MAKSSSTGSQFADELHTGLYDLVDSSDEEVIGTWYHFDPGVHPRLRKVSHSLERANLIPLRDDQQFGSLIACDIGHCIQTVLA